MLDELAVDALAVARITRLVTTDSITESLRERVIVRIYRATGSTLQAASTRPGGRWPGTIDHDGAPWPARLLTCPWCASVHVAACVAVCRRTAPRTWGVAARWLAVAHVAGHVAALDA